MLFYCAPRSLPSCSCGEVADKTENRTDNNTEGIEAVLKCVETSVRVSTCERDQAKQAEGERSHSDEEDDLKRDHESSIVPLALEDTEHIVLAGYATQCFVVANDRLVAVVTAMSHSSWNTITLLCKAGG